MFARLRRLRLNEHSRNLVRETHLRLEDFIYPLFVIEGKGIRNEIPSMPGVFQLSIYELLKEIKNLCISFYLAFPRIKILSAQAR